ncbi:MAG: ATPase, partial [Eubacteriales bacterium]|nr:ATPase [Eubacteriales bacterium]
DVCHACGGCALVCPAGAVTEKPRSVGILESGMWNQVRVITGILNLGEASAVPVIKAALNKGLVNNGLNIIDCPPGSGCSVMESVSEADYCILVAEPTAFGLHNLKMVHTLIKQMHRPCGVVINKADSEYTPLAEYCKQSNLKILCSIPYRSDVASLNADGEVACLHNEEVKALFYRLLQSIPAEVNA